ncbi:hypothetical protein [Pontimicrobium sp. SW4]|uniref:Alpha/beta hydrolase n=1 Tax=Pontimicrobium sp. SW4 TaxID=3153519 RepID=A0AAU7BU10_9FLAO
MKRLKSSYQSLKKQFSTLLFFTIIVFSCKSETEVYVCTPCNLSCDELIFTKLGTCPHCGMDLIKKSELFLNENQTVIDVEIQTGSGSFFIEGGVGNEEKPIEVHYHRPDSFTQDSEILLLIPGAGRNGNTYRDSWIEESEKKSILILSPMYSEKHYSFDAYHLGGLIKNSNLYDCIERVEGTNKIKLNEEKLKFDSNSNTSEWLFNDFDRIFDIAVETLNSNQTTYNLFGHSAGGHILHRFALFQEYTKANNILASNASFYTLPNFDNPYPFGLKNTPIDEVSLKNAFKKRLVVFLGEEDNENETGGSFLQSKSADEQGHHRLERGKFFFKQAKEMAKRLNTEFNWELKTVPGVGHDYKNMGLAASNYLY